MRTTPTPLLYLVLIALAFIAAEGDEPASPEQQELDHEQRAQKALTDSLTDAIAMLRHGSASAKESAAHSVASMAVETTLSQPFHPVTFRNACVNSGVVEELANLLKGKQSPNAQLHALEALEAIATDDPTTDVDNGHALAVWYVCALRSESLLSSACPGASATRDSASCHAATQVLSARSFSFYHRRMSISRSLRLRARPYLRKILLVKRNSSNEVRSSRLWPSDPTGTMQRECSQWPPSTCSC